jgi:TolB-like protein
MKYTTFVLVCLLTCMCLAQVKKTTIAVMSFKGSSGVTQDESDLLTDRLRVELFNTGAVDVMERDQMQAILKEQGFQKSGACTDEGCMVEMGEILGVQKLITGSIGKIGSMYILNARIIDIKTAKITRSVSEDIKGKLEEVVEHLPGIAARLCAVQGPDADVARQKKADDSREKPVEKTDKTPAPLDCKNKVLIEKTEFSQSSLGFVMTSEEWQSAYDELIDEIKSCFKAELCCASGDRIAAAGYTGTVIRPSLNSYTTKPTKMRQKEGTLDLTLAIYDSPNSKDPLCVFRKEATGDNHWGDRIPFKNAMEAVGEQMKKEIDKSDCLGTINRKPK